MFIFLLALLFQFFLLSRSATIMVGGSSHWENPTVHVGDSVIFKHKYHYKLYVFQNKNAFNLCNFTQASLLTKHNSTSYEWHPSRPGFFYFTFNNNNGSTKTCRASQKLSVKVTPAEYEATVPPELPPAGAPAPTSGGIVVSSSSPGYPWPFQPRQAVSPAPIIVPDKGGDQGQGIPFINSNPAVPLPTDEVDSTTIRPLPTSDHGGKAAVGMLTAPMALFSMAFLAL
ncbi:hypothetical protein V6N13_110153 [Hibiscus sabdariffa]